MLLRFSVLSFCFCSRRSNASVRFWQLHGWERNDVFFYWRKIHKPAPLTGLCFESKDSLDIQSRRAEQTCSPRGRNELCSLFWVVRCVVQLLFCRCGDSSLFCRLCKLRLERDFWIEYRSRASKLSHWPLIWKDGWMYCSQVTSKTKTTQNSKYKILKSNKRNINCRVRLFRKVTSLFIQCR